MGWHIGGMREPHEEDWPTVRQLHRFQRIQSWSAKSWPNAVLIIDLLVKTVKIRGATQTIRSFVSKRSPNGFKTPSKGIVYCKFCLWQQYLRQTWHLTEGTIIRETWNLWHWLCDCLQLGVGKMVSKLSTRTKGMARNCNWSLEKMMIHVKSLQNNWLTCCLK